MMVYFLRIFVVLMFVPLQSWAQEQDDLAVRLDLAQQMQELRPASVQVNDAIDQYVTTLRPELRDKYRAGLRGMLNVKALEKISIDAYAQVYTQAELEAMIEYYSKPEAISASKKFDQYGALVYPEIVRMLDRAVMRIRTGEN